MTFEIFDQGAFFYNFFIFWIIFELFRQLDNLRQLLTIVDNFFYHFLKTCSNANLRYCAKDHADNISSFRKKDLLQEMLIAFGQDYLKSYLGIFPPTTHKEKAS